MTPVPSLVIPRRQVPKMILPSQARSFLLTLSTVILLPTTRSRQNRATVQLLSTPQQERGRTCQTPTSTARYFTVTVTDDEGHTETQVVSLIVASVNDPGSFTGNTSATGSEDDSAIRHACLY